MGKLIPRGHDVLDQVREQYPFEIDHLAGNAKMMLIDLINSAQLEAYEAGREETSRIAQNLAARKKVEYDKL